MFTIYSKDNCGNCVSAKNLLQTKNLAFEEVKLNRDISLEEFKKVIDLVLYIFKTLKFENFKAQISLRDPETS